MNKQLDGLFGLYCEAVIAADGDNIVYHNASAQKLFPDIARLSLRDIIPDTALEMESDCFVGEADFAGRRAAYSVAKLGDLKIFSILAPQDGGEMVSTAAFSAFSMEMKEYLTALRSAASFVLPFIEDTKDERISQYAAMMNKSVHNISRLTMNMEVLGFGQTGPGLVRGRFDLVAVCRETVEACAHLTRGLGVDLSFNCALDRLDIFADEEKIVQMLLNMISNSIIYTQKNGKALLTVSRTGSSALIKLADTGSGIPDTVKPTAWGRFSEQSQLTATNGGAGFGLAAVSRIARLHGGNVLLNSREGEGTTIAASIPIEAFGASSLKSDVDYYRSSGNTQLLTGLSTVISYDKFKQKYMD